MAIPRDLGRVLRQRVQPHRHHVVVQDSLELIQRRITGLGVQGVSSGPGRLLVGPGTLVRWGSGFAPPVRFLLAVLLRPLTLKPLSYLGKKLLTIVLVLVVMAGEVRVVVVLGTQRR